DDWAYGGAASPGDYMNRINNSYGTATGIDDFCKKAQLINLETHRAMYEGFQDHIWNDASGLLLWMSQSAFPTMIWQTYDYYLDCTGSYYGVKKACEPLHVQYSPADNSVKVVNTTGKTVNSLTVKSTLYNMDGTVANGYSSTKVINALKDTITYAFNAYGSNNLALNKTGTASGQEANNPTPRAFDGNVATRWASNSSANNTWIYVDLGTQKTFSAVNLVWESYAKSYKIQVSNDAVNWTDVYSTTTGNGGTDAITFAPTTARYVKMQTVEKGTFFGVSLFEFAIYESGPSPLSAVHFIKLELKDAGGNLISDNLYWKSNDNKYAALDSMPQVTLTTTVSIENLGKKKLMKVKLLNPANSAGIAFGIHVQLLNPTTNERVLPVLISDNYFTILKGEEKNITIEYDPSLVSGTPKLDVKQYTSQPVQQLNKTIQSPDSKVDFSLFVKNNRAYYEVKRDGKPVIEASPLVVSVNGKLTNEVKAVELLNKIGMAETYPTRGVHSQATSNCTDAEYSVTGSGNSNFTVHVKVFNDGAAFRYEIPVTGSNSLPADSTGFTIPAGSMIWSQGDLSSYEGTYTRRAIENVNNGLNAGPPVTIKLPGDNGYAAISEGGLTNFGGMALKFAGNRMFRANIRGANNFSGPINTPWRIIQVGKDLNTLVNSDIVANVSPRPDPVLFPNGVNESWLKPGKSAWSWIATTGTSIFEVSYKNMLRYSQKAGQIGLEYNLVDQGWEYFWATKTQTKWDVLKDLVDKSNEVGVKIWVWKSYTPISFWKDQGLKDPKWRRDFFDSCRRVGVVGLKLDFFTGENQEVAKWQEDALKDAAEMHLMIDFHGTPKPAGTQHAWPNEMTREGIRGLEYGTDNTVWSTHNTIVPFTRFLAGHADYTPFSLRSDVGKGTTLAHQIATIALFTSPMMVLGANPDSLAVSPVKDIIKAIPTVWDETVVLPPSEIGEIAVFARRSGKAWFLSVLNNATAKSAAIKLSFLGAGSWHATEMKEGAAINKVVLTTGSYSNSGQISLALPAGGGYLARFEQ
ncbi:MAG: glycoside hydrolase family 97 catalytic domain-containing protein, partial [Mucilaginibacter sp.]